MLWVSWNHWKHVLNGSTKRKLSNDAVILTMHANSVSYNKNCFHLSIWTTGINYLSLNLKYFRKLLLSYRQRNLICKILNVADVSTGVTLQRNLNALVWPQGWLPVIFKFSWCHDLLRYASGWVSLGCG